MSTFETHHEDAPLGMEGGAPEVASKEEAQRILDKADLEVQRRAKEAQQKAERETLSLEHWARVEGNRQRDAARMSQYLETGDEGPDRPYFEQKNEAADNLEKFLDHVENRDVALLISPKIDTVLKDRTIQFLAAASIDMTSDGQRARVILANFADAVLEMARGRDPRDHGFDDINAVSKAAGELKRAVKSYNPQAGEAESGEYLNQVSNALRVIIENNVLYLDQPESTPDPFAKVKSSKRKRK